MASKVLTVNQELISYTYPHRAMRMVWFGVLGFVWNHSASAILQQQKKGGKKENKEEDSGIGNSSKEAVVSSWVHAALCALREQLCECLWGSALQRCSMARAAVTPRGCSPSLLPSGARFLLQTIQWGKTPWRAPAWGHPPSHILHHSQLWGRWAGEDLVDPNKRQERGVILSQTLLIFKV